MTEKAKPDLTFVVLDYETTGIDPHEGHNILEVAAIHVDFKTLEVLDTFQTVVGQKPPEGLMDAFVTDMHTKNGLLQEVYAAAENPAHGVKSHRELGLVLHSFLLAATQRINGDAFDGVKNVQLCGNTIHFDRKFTEVCLSKVEPLLFYRLMDASSFITAYEEWCGKMPETEKAHRSMADCEKSLNALRFFRDVFRRGAPIVTHVAGG